jgi:hypothetical protein
MQEKEEGDETPAPADTAATTGSDDATAIKESPRTPSNKLTGYGLTPVMIEELRTALSQFEYASKLLKDLLSNRKRSDKKSDFLIKSNRELLEHRLDKLMTVFSGTHPSFFQEYTELRKVTKPSSIH